MTPQQVDVKNHIRISDLLSANFPSYDFRLDETVNARDFINKEVYYPAGLYQLPRSRASVNVTIPPLSGFDTKKLDMSNVQNPGKIKIGRSVNNNFYNRIEYRFNYDVIAGQFKRSFSKTSTTSGDRISIKSKTLYVRSKGLRETQLSFIQSQVNRFLDRYQFGSESVKSVKVLYNEGLQIDPGDAVIFGNAEMKISDSKTGTRAFQERLFEVINKSMSIKTGDTSLDLLDTGFDLNSRIGTISPASLVRTGATTTDIPIENIFGLTPLRETDKWVRYIGQKIVVRSEDFSTITETVITGVHSTKLDTLVVSPALGAPPTSGYVVESPAYPNNTDKTDMSFWKSTHVYMTPQVAVVSGSSQTVFDVAPGDVGKFFVGSVVELHTEDYSSISNEATVNDITSNTITVDTALGFVPNNTYLIELIGFLDEGAPYRVI